MLPGPDGGFVVYYQDPSNHLIQLDNEWKSTTVPADAVSGGPISVTYIDGKVSVAYLASDSQSIAYVTKSGEGWTNAVPFAKCDGGDPLTRFFIGWDNEEDVVELYGVSTGGKLELFKQEGGGKSILGKVDKEGNLIPTISAECGFWLNRRIMKNITYNNTTYNITNIGSGNVTIR